MNPAAIETWYDGIDQDCDGADDDQDADGYLLAEDCDDADATVNPAATDPCADGIDQDCDGVDTCPAESDDCGCSAPHGGASPALLAGIALLLARRRGSFARPRPAAPR